MQSAQVTDDNAQIPIDFDLDQYIAQGHMGYMSPCSESILLQAIFKGHAAQTIVETPLSEDQKAEPWGDDEVIVKATIIQTKELEAWLLGLGPCVEVLKPQALRDHIRDQIQQMMIRYEQ